MSDGKVFQSVGAATGLASCILHMKGKQRNWYLTLNIATSAWLSRD